MTMHCRACCMRTTVFFCFAPSSASSCTASHISLRWPGRVVANAGCHGDSVTARQGKQHVRDIVVARRAKPGQDGALLMWKLMKLSHCGGRLQWPSPANGRRRGAAIPAESSSTEPPSPSVAVQPPARVQGTSTSILVQRRQDDSLLSGGGPGGGW